MGLATVYGIVQQMEGTIWVYSESGKGTTFKICFPVIQAGARPEEMPEDRAASGEEERILLVEDAEGVRKFVRTILEKQGYTVREAANTDEALSLMALTSDRIDLLLTDVILPGMNGPELAACLSLLRPGLKVLFMSGYPDGTIRLQKRLGDESNFIQKPFTPNSLARKVKGLLGKPTREQV